MKVYAVYRNSDLTEGRGSSRFVALFATEAAAQEAAIGIDVQGSNGVVREHTVYEEYEGWLADATGWERDQHLTRLHRARQRLDGMIDSMEAKKALEAKA